MMDRNSYLRYALPIVAGLSLAMSGCNWFRPNTGYQTSPESRPLEVPPDLDAPPRDDTMRIPEVAGGSGSSARASAPAGAVADFRLDEPAAGAWRRLGIALERIDGVSVQERAELLGVYTVSYQGSEFLVRVQAEREGSRVTAVDAQGRAATSGAATSLLGVLKQRLGGS
ncbi:MAG TPA: hypothetical protein VFG21_03230 [Xanthomonadaceae bacterium]|nr:hypothetical protein [Xanthomonadaceae bacterium]